MKILEARENPSQGIAKRYNTKPNTNRSRVPWFDAPLDDSI
jgi:hypothetical protein